ncbi:MAG: T9SS type A sorting domain-containing protein [Saprospiraceae bacterium]
MKIHQTLLLILFTISLQSQSITFGPATTLFTLDAAHWALSQPMIPTVSSDGKHVDFYGLTGSTYKKHIYTAGSYPATSFMLFGDFNYITDVHDFDGDGKVDILTDADIYRSKGNNVYERVPLGNISYEVEGSLDYDGDGLKDVLVTEDDFSSGLTSLYVLRNKGNFTFEKIIVEQNKRNMYTVITADINGDKRDDIITITSSDVTPFAIFVSNADGAFTTREIKGNDKYFLQHTLSLTDMDKDGDLDLAVMDYEKGLWFFENQNGFATSVRRKDTSFDAVANGLMVQCDDLNGDGWPEMIVSTLTATTLSIQVSKGTGPFEFDALQNVGTVLGGTGDGFAPQGRAITRMLHTIDINADGKKDIVMTSTFDKKQVAWINNSLISSSEDDILDEVAIYPNPSGDYIHVISEGTLFYRIINMSGMPCLDGSITNQLIIDIGTLSHGAYFLVLTNQKGQSTTHKLILH